MKKPAIYCKYLNHDCDDAFDEELDNDDDNDNVEFKHEISSCVIEGIEPIKKAFSENKTYNLNHLKSFVERAFPLCGIPIRKNRTLISCPFEVISNQKNNYNDIVDAIDSDGGCEIIKVSDIFADNGRKHTEIACKNADTYLGHSSQASYGQADDEILG